MAEVTPKFCITTLDKRETCKAARSKILLVDHKDFFPRWRYPSTVNYCCYQKKLLAVFLTEKATGLCSWTASDAIFELLLLFATIYGKISNSAYFFWVINSETNEVCRGSAMQLAFSKGHRQSSYCYFFCGRFTLLLFINYPGVKLTVTAH